MLHGIVNLVKNGANFFNVYITNIGFFTPLVFFHVCGILHKVVHNGKDS